MRNYLAQAIANLHAQGLELEHLELGSAIPRKCLKDIREVIAVADPHFVHTDFRKPTNVPNYLIDSFSQLEETTTFTFGKAKYRVGIVDTGLRHPEYKNGEKLEALALVGMIVEASVGKAIDVGSACSITMLDEVGILTSSKFIGTELTIVNVLYPKSSQRKDASIYDPSDLKQSKAELSRAHQAIAYNMEEVLKYLGMLEMTYFGFETVLKTIQEQSSGN